MVSTLKQKYRFSKWAALILLCVLQFPEALAQELSPRLYWPAPEGTRLFILGYQRSNGDVLTDPSIPIVGIDSSINTLFAGYVQTISLFGRTSNLLVEAPYSWGSTQGLVDDITLNRDFAGFNDISVSMTLNLLGAPSMTREEFQALRADPHPIIGLNMKLVLPTGYYEKDRLINTGSNRWAARLQIGAILPLQARWLFEVAAGGWFFGDDNDYISGRREQESIFAAEAHLIHRFKPGFWASFDANYFTGGNQTIGGVEQFDKQKNSRIGATLALPLSKGRAFKLVYSSGARTRFGSDFNQFTLSYQQLLQ